MDRPDPDERFVIEGDPEEALRAALGADPGSIPALGARRRAALHDVQEAQHAYDIAVENAKRAELIPAQQPEVELARQSLDRAKLDWQRAELDHRTALDNARSTSGAE